MKKLKIHKKHRKELYELIELFNLADRRAVFTQETVSVAAKYLLRAYFAAHSLDTEHECTDIIQHYLRRLSQEELKKIIRSEKKTVKNRVYTLFLEYLELFKGFI
jgi:DNA-directed RNA polymerase specialized sigma24 family protein